MGFLNINKPSGLTSHDVVARVRRIAKKSLGKKVKVGHAGTLDPLATGVLVVCIGHATRLSEYAMQSKKHYRAQVHLGIQTDTYDADGEIIAQTDASHITHDDVEARLAQFRGDIEQVPPMYSAIKQGGKKLYELARDGVEVERPARPVSIYDLQLSGWQPPQFTLDVSCSPGTYIRSLAYDIGDALGVGAHLASLVRTRSGRFALEEAIALDDLLADEHWMRHLIDPAKALADWQTLQLSAQDCEEIMHGRRIENAATISDTYVMALMPDGHLLAVLENHGNTWKPHKVFLPSS